MYMFKVLGIFVNELLITLKIGDIFIKKYLDGGVQIHQE